MSHWEAPGKSNDWFTPTEVFEALGCTFDMDVAANPKANVPAASMLFAGGLEQAWRGFVWMNPPFGGRNAIGPWLNRFVTHGNGIALTPDRTSAPWFQDYAPAMSAILFTRKLRFLRPDGTEGKSPSNGTALMAMGWRGVAALHRAHEEGFGFLVAPGNIVSRRVAA
jgi:hypothetical protein